MTLLAALRGVSGYAPGAASVTYISALGAERVFNGFSIATLNLTIGLAPPYSSLRPVSLCSEVPIPESLAVTGIEVFCRSFCLRSRALLFSRLRNFSFYLFHPLLVIDTKSQPNNKLNEAMKANKLGMCTSNGMSAAN